MGNSPIRGRVWDYFIPHGDINMKKTFPIGFGGDGDVPLLPIPVTRWGPDNTVHSIAQPNRVHQSCFLHYVYSVPYQFATESWILVWVVAYNT